MGRLPALILSRGTRGLLVAWLGPALLGAAGCPRSEPAPSSRRSESVLADPARPGVPAGQEAGPGAHGADRGGARRVLCAGPLLDRALPEGRVARREASSAPPLPDRIPRGGGRWTWISLWAAWCVPCKEETPRLIRWRDELGIGLAFLSLDDDERQLLRHLESQPEGGLRASFWLPPGPGRKAWLASFDLEESPRLPVQVLLDRGGRVRCIVEGAVEDGDLQRVRALVER